MLRNLSLIFALFTVIATPAISADLQGSHAQDARHLVRVAAKHGSATVAPPQHDIVAMNRPDDAFDGWPVETTAAAPDSMGIQAPGESSMNIWGTLAAALGIGAISIVRRMGRF